MLYWPLYEMHLSDAKMRDVWSESHTIASWLRVEQTLAEQQAKLQLISKSTAAALAAVVLDDLDRDVLINDMQLTGRPIVGLVKQLREKVPLESQHEVHYGTTTQDIMDSATILQMKEGISLIIERLEAIKTQLVGFEIQHDSDSVMARTNGQYAMPIGLPQKFQVWRHELDRRQVAIETSAKRGLLLQLGGPVGDLHLMGQKGDALKSNVAKSLGLETATLHWQNSRDALAEIISSMGLLCTSLLKIGHNINLLSSSDIAEFNESNRSGWGSSSVMHHKRNQRCSEFAEATARLGRQLAEGINETSIHQHERSGGVWISEWYIVPQVFLFCSGALMWTERIFATMEVNQEKIQQHLSKLPNNS